MVRIFGKDLYWKEKLLVFTWHFYEEWESIGKPLHRVLEMLEEGEHFLISKNQNKHEAYYPYRGKYLCLSYAEHEDSIVMIHMKPITRKPEKKK